MMSIRFRYPAIGVLAGLAFSVLVLLVSWVRVMESQYQRKSFYYEGFLFHEKCKAEGKSDLQAATERYQVIHSRPNFSSNDHSDVQRGHPEAFIRGTLGYELWDGFGYGKKPGRLETFFERRTITDAYAFMRMLSYPFIIMLAAPFIGGFVGIVLSAKQSKGS